MDLLISKDCLIQVARVSRRNRGSTGRHLVKFVPSIK